MVLEVCVCIAHTNIIYKPEGDVWVGIEEREDRKDQLQTNIQHQPDFHVVSRIYLYMKHPYNTGL